MSRRLPSAVRVLLALVAIHLGAACSGPVAPAKGPVVLAAASLQEALTEVAGAWARQGHSPAVLSFAGTPALARQIQQGAPADVFVSADEQWADTLDKQKLLRAGTRGDLLSNSLVLIRPHGEAVGHLRELGREKLALADPASVPAGKYARAALQAIGEWPRVKDRVVTAENVRAALRLVESGEAALGIVYATDAKASGKVEVLETLPEGSHPPIRYPVAVIGASRNPDAESFRAFLFSRDAARIFTAHGFGIVQPPTK